MRWLHNNCININQNWTQSDFSVILRFVQTTFLINVNANEKLIYDFSANYMFCLKHSVSFKSCHKTAFKENRTKKLLVLIQRKQQYQGQNLYGSGGVTHVLLFLVPSTNRKSTAGFWPSSLGRVTGSPCHVTSTQSWSDSAPLPQDLWPIQVALSPCHYWLLYGPLSVNIKLLHILLN